MPTRKDNDNFISYIMGNDTLDSAIEYIRQSMEPEDVFSTDELDKWAEANGYVKE